MVFLTKASRNASLSWHSTLHRRALTTTSSARVRKTGTDNDDTLNDARKPVVTKKKFARLPKVRVDSEGLPLPPLSTWRGGLEIPDLISPTENPSLLISPDKSGSSSLSCQTGEDTSLTDISAAQTAKGSSKKRGKRRVKVDLEPEGEAATNASTSSAAVIDEMTEISEPINASPKRSRRRRAIPLPNEDIDPSVKTPLATEILGNLTRFPHCVLLTRVGQFYESYFEQAAEVSRLLNIKLTQKTWGGQRILMCGFPLMHLDKYLRILVQQHNKFVAMCEEFPRIPHLGAKGGFDRRVTRIVTPGTLIDEPFINPYENNYLLSITTSPVPSSEPSNSATNSETTIGLAWIDISTGDFFARNVPLDSLRDELVRIGPREVVLDDKIKQTPSHPIIRIVSEEECFVSYCDPVPAVEPQPTVEATAVLAGADDLITQLNLSKAGYELEGPELNAVQLLTAFLRANLLEHMPQMSSPSRETANGRMLIDAHTIKALEIRESMREGGSTGSLLSVIKRTVTNSGTRLLARWLCSPSTCAKEIVARQSLVAFFHSRPFFRQDLAQLLRDTEDTTRIVQKFSLGRGDTSDLSSICLTIKLWSSIKNRIEEEKVIEQAKFHDLMDERMNIDSLLTRMSDLDPLADRIALALVDRQSDVSSTSTPEVDDVSSESREAMATYAPAAWKINPEFSDHLRALHITLNVLLEQRQKLERHLQLTYDASSLTLRSSPGQGPHVHIARTKRDTTKLKESPSFIPISEGATTSTFFFQEWSRLGAQILETTTSIAQAERDAFEVLRNEVNLASLQLRRNSRIVDELDVTLAFANLASDLNLVKPTILEDASYRVINGRHPTVELGLLGAGRVFTPNSVSFADDSSLHVITGPNMAGKSTLLRQTALITILAQIGSFVPAETAEIGIVDRVFSRVGAKDDLFHDRSTFMVEMLETSEILRRATPRSLVIMDEVGRGTTVEDGLAIAFAVVYHLLTVNSCRALFATHFHELADMLGYSTTHKGQGAFSRVSFYCTDVDETEDGYFAYSHRLRPGVNRDSHGLKVAQLSGMPASAVRVADTALKWLKHRRESLPNDRARLQTLGQSLASNYITDI